MENLVLRSVYTNRTKRISSVAFNKKVRRSRSKAVQKTSHQTGEIIYFTGRISFIRFSWPLRRGWDHLGTLGPEKKPEYDRAYYRDSCTSWRYRARPAGRRRNRKHCYSYTTCARTMICLSRLVPDVWLNRAVFSHPTCIACALTAVAVVTGATIPPPVARNDVYYHFTSKLRTTRYVRWTLYPRKKAITLAAVKSS